MIELANLLEAIRRGSCGKVRSLVNKKPELLLCVLYTGDTALHKAVQDCPYVVFLNMVKILVEAGSGLFAENMGGRTPEEAAIVRLRTASSKEEKEAVQSVITFLRVRSNKGP